MRIVVLGAGFGGLEVATTLSEEFGDGIDVVLIDQSDGFVFGFSKLDVMFGHALAEAVRHPYSAIDRPGVTFVQTTVTAIDPAARRVETDAGTYDADILVVALGADLVPEATPGLVETAAAGAGGEFYTVAGAFALRETLADFAGGRVIVGVTKPPFKCPPAPSETALMLHDFLVAKGVRDQSQIDLVMPLPVPIPPSPDASSFLLGAFEARGIGWHPQMGVVGLDADRRVANLSDGSEMPFDLFLGIPVHVVPAVVEASGLAVDGWIPVDPSTLETSFEGVYAIGDVTSVGTPKAGVFAEGQAETAAARIAATVRGATSDQGYGGKGVCYIETGDEQIAKVEVTFLPGQMPHGELQGPSVELVADKAEFGTTRVRRWFGMDWPA